MTVSTSTVGILVGVMLLTERHYNSFTLFSLITESYTSELVDIHWECVFV
jgi:hypothetical protein